MRRCAGSLSRWRPFTKTVKPIGNAGEATLDSPGWKLGVTESVRVHQNGEKELDRVDRLRGASHNDGMAPHCQ